MKFNRQKMLNSDSKFRKHYILLLFPFLIAAVSSDLSAQDYRQSEQPRRVVIRFMTDGDRKSTRLNSSHVSESRMPSSA